MEAVQNESVHNTKSNSAVSCINETNTDELSKEKDELLSGAEEDGEDEDALSDDSLRLRLSDDEDIEQEVIVKNHTNISEFKSPSRNPEKSSKDMITEENSNSDSQQVVEGAIKSSGEELISKEPNSDKNLEVTEVDNVKCTKETSEENILENDHLSIDIPAETNSRNVELKNNSGMKLKEAVNECDEIDSVTTCNSNNLNISDDNNHLVNSAKIKICKDEKLSTTTTISDKCDDNLTILNDNVIEKDILKRPFIEIDNSHDSTDAVRSYNSDDNSSSIIYSNKFQSKMESLKHNDITQQANTPKMQSVQREMNLELENLNHSSVVIDKTEITNEDRDINKSISETTDNNATSTKPTSLVPINMKDNDESETDNTCIIVQSRKRLKKNEKLGNGAVQDCIIEEDKQEVKNNGRQKRRTARNAEEIIRRKYLNSDSDTSDSDSDSEEHSVASSYKSNQNVSSASTTSLKRNCPISDEDVLLNGTVKKVKISNKSEQTNVKTDFTKLGFIEKFFQRSIKEKMPKLTQEELEELLIQKIVETITMRSEIGLLREQARISERNQEVTRTKLQQLMKQVKDFEMVLNRNAADRRTNPDKIVTPIKINRSVGLQVNFITEHGMQNLRQIQQNSQQKATNAPSNVGASVPESTSKTNLSPRRGIKIRSPRRSEASMAPSTPAISQTSPLISTVTPAALVVAKPLDSQQTLTLPNQSASTIQQILTGNISQQQTYVLNGKIQNQTNRSNTTLITPKQKNNDLIDLTDEEEKSKSAKVTAAPAPTLIEQQLPTAITTKSVQCFPRVIQTIPTNVSITTQSASIRVVQPNQPTPSAAVVIRPVTTCKVTTPFSAVTYKTGTSTIANGTVRVLTTPAISNIPINITSKHPAPLPDTPSYTINSNWKLPPPAPSLKMSKVPNGIVLSWNMQLTDKYADIASYQLYAYQEVAGVPPSTSLWKKVGDVRALPLPMACTLTQFSEGNNYYFAVRAVDTHSRKGQYSIPGNISL